MEYGQPFIVITGGLVRTEAVKFESLAFVIAHELGHLYGGEPANAHGYSCEGTADYAAIVAMMPKVWLGLRVAPIIRHGVEQIKELFGYISKEKAAGTPGSKCMDIGIECRLATIDAAFTLNPLPECAGGPPAAALEVAGAEVAGDGLQVVVSYNLPVDPKSALAIGNYAFNPELAVDSAALEGAGGTRVALGLAAPLKAGVTYEVLVSGVLSANQQPLVDGKNTTTFQAPPAQGGAA